MSDLVTRLRVRWEAMGDMANTERAEAADEIERLWAERDEARREVCRWRARSRARSAKWIAEALRWDCFKADDSNYRGILGNSNPPNEMGRDSLKEPREADAANAEFRKGTIND